ncbi:MAG: hypothetical protein LIO87_03470, partial [Eubacterium sp.]|nr:hypothetical protein [Eubacterium sp.]
FNEVIMSIFIILFATAVIIIFFYLALARGSQNRKEIDEIERAEKGLAPEEKTSEEETSSGFSLKTIGLGKEGNKNAVGRTLKQLGAVVILGGTLISLCTAAKAPDGLFSGQYEFSLLMFFTCELISLAGGFLFIGMGEIIGLLDSINKALHKR